MKFKTYLEQITGVSIYPLISLLLFAVVFAFVLYTVMRADKKSISEQKKLPLD
jgi:cytochrome c oxidase cbb3-type subunit III